jgi:hypothetical protein
MKDTFEPIRDAEFYNYELERVRTNPNISPMQGINTFCRFICPYCETENHYECRKPSCPMGIIKQRMTDLQKERPIPSRKQQYQKPKRYTLTKEQYDDLIQMGCSVTDKGDHVTVSIGNYSLSFSHEDILENGFCTYYNMLYDHK